MADRAGEATRRVTGPLLALGWVGLAWFAVVTPGVRDSALRSVTAYPVVFLLPGYALLAGLFPGGGLPSVERLAYAVALSVATSILVGIALFLTPWGVTAASALAALSTVVVAGITVSWWRTEIPDAGVSFDSVSGSIGNRLGNDDPSTERRTDPTNWLSLVPYGGTTADGGPERAVLVTVAAIVLVGGLAGGAGASFLLGVHEPPGHATLEVSPQNATWDGPPRVVNAGDGLTVRVTSHRTGIVEYTVEALVQRVTVDDDVNVVETRTVERFTVRLDEEEAWTTRHTPSVPWDDDETRVAYRLSLDGEQRSQVHVWVGNDDTDEGGSDPR